MKKFTENINQKSIFDDVEILKPMLSSLGNYKIQTCIFTERGEDLLNIVSPRNCIIWNEKEFMKHNVKTSNQVFAYKIIITNEINPLVRDAQRSGNIFYIINGDFFELMEKIDHLKYDLETDGYTTAISFDDEDKTNLPISLMIFNGKFK